MGSFLRSMPWSRLNSLASQSTSALSKLSPPRWVFPAVDLTSKTPSPMSRTDTSNVPPPRSKTRIVWSVSLSRPQARAAADAGAWLAAFLGAPVGEGGRGRFVDDAQALEAGEGARLLRGLALSVV